MKLKFYVILILCLILSNKVGAQGYQLSADKKTITVEADCTIPLESFAPNSVTDIYGNRGKGGENGLFAKKCAELNKNVRGITFIQENTIAVIKISFSKLTDNTSLTFYEAKSREIEKEDSTGVKRKLIDWIPDTSKKFSITITKKQEEVASSTIGNNTTTILPDNQTVNNSIEINELKDIVDGLSNKIKRLEKEVGIEKNEGIDKSLVILGVIIVLLVGFLRYRDKKEAQKDFKYLDSALEKNVKELNLKIANISNSQHTPSAKSKGGSTMTDEDIKRFIAEQIKSIHPQMSTPSPLILPPTVQNSTSAKDNDQLHDTEDVKYHQEDNSFSLEPTDIHIFKIYSRKGEYFYTIVDDSAVREELGGMLQMFEGCITYQTTDGVAKRVEPVTDGRLRKGNNKFYVDPSNKLVVKFV